MERVLAMSSEPPSPVSYVPGEAVSLPARAFGFGTTRYVAFLEALVDGLRAYEVMKSGRKGSGYAAHPLPAA
jgi:hypothetical protein